MLGNRAQQERGHRNLIRYMRFLAATWPGHTRARDLVLDMASEQSLDRGTVSAEILAAAGEALANGWRGDPEAFTFVTNHAASSLDARIRAGLAQSVANGWKGRADALAFLQNRATDDPDADGRVGALMAIANGWRGNAAILPFIQTRATAEESDSARRGALLAMVQGWHDHPQTLTFLREMATTATIDEVRIAALHAIVSGGLSDPEVIQFVRECAITDPSPQCRGAALMFLAQDRLLVDADLVFFLYDRSVEETDPEATEAAQRALEMVVARLWLPAFWYQIGSRLSSPTVALRHSAIAVLRRILDQPSVGLDHDSFGAGSYIESLLLHARRRRGRRNSRKRQRTGGAAEPEAVARTTSPGGGVVAIVEWNPRRSAARRPQGSP